MGAKESRIGFLSYEEALRRVTDVELKRLKDAFKRTCGLSYYMGQHCFIREVLGDGVPPKVAETREIMLDNKQIRAILLLKFKMGHKAAETPYNINVFGPGAANECTVQQWFKKFCKEGESLEDEKYSGRPSEIDNSQQRA